MAGSGIAEIPETTGMFGARRIPECDLDPRYGRTLVEVVAGKQAEGSIDAPDGRRDENGCPQESRFVVRNGLDAEWHRTAGGIHDLKFRNGQGIRTGATTLERSI